MAGDYLPRTDLDLKAWLDNFATVLSAHVGDLGLTPEDVAPIGAGKTTFGTAITDQQTKRQAAKTATAVKDSSRESVVSLTRTMVRRIDGNPGLTEQLRGDLGLPIHDTERTPSGEPGPEIPLLRLESQVGQVTVHFGTEPGNERINTRPSWATGCNIYRKKAGEADFQLIAFERVSPYIDPIFGDGADYTYFAQYRGSKASDLGGESSEATIAARGNMAA